MSSVLFLLLKSPHEFGEGTHLLRQVRGKRQGAALLFEDASLFAVDAQRSKALLGAVDQAYVMKDDLAARGFAGKALPGFKEIDYAEAVDLIMERYDQTITL
ncbi:MAG: sulfurtransferase complex subunit TusB [Methanomassiliicoccales archaeon]